MKKITFLTLLLMLSLSKSITAQFETIFGDTTTSWEILIGACDAWCSSTSSVEGDTMINSNTYKIINDDAPFSQVQFLREDTLQGKVWYYDEDENMEYLLMDLGLAVGDTFEIFNGLNAQIETYTVDSVYSFNNKKHIRLSNYRNLCMQNDLQLIFIEGVGTSAGLTYKGQAYKNKIVLCHKKNVANNVLYDSYFQEYYFIDNCEYCVASTEKLLLPTNFKIFPNPFDDVIHISSEEYSIEYEIYDIAGKLIKVENTDKKFHSLNTMDLQLGIYILVLKQENTIIGTKKLVKVNK